MKFIKKISLTILILSLLTQCAKPKTTNKVDIDIAIEMLCPGAPPTLILRISKIELREAMRKQYTHDDTVDTVLKLPNKAIVMIPNVRPRDVNQCLLRELPAIKIPASMGY